MILRAALLAAILAGAPGAADGDVVPIAPLDSVLSRFVRGASVDYGRLARDPGALRRFLATTQAARPERHGRSEQIAFWVNAYNARVLDAVIRRPGIGSVLDSVPGMAAFFREQRLTAGRRLSLDDIERDILRGRFREPRVHFVLNCASTSCPELPSQALTGANLDSMLDSGTRRFLADRSRNRHGEDGALELSAIFQWYRDDFTPAGGPVAFAARYGLTGRSRRAVTRFLPYDWSLNGRW